MALSTTLMDVIMRSSLSGRTAPSQTTVRTLESLIIGDKYTKLRVRFAHKILKLEILTLNTPQYQELSVMKIRGCEGGDRTDAEQLERRPGV